VENTAMTARLGTQNLQNVLVFIVKLTMYFTKLALQLLIFHYFYCHSIDMFVFLAKADQNQLVFIVPL